MKKIVKYFGFALIFIFSLNIQAEAVDKFITGFYHPTGKIEAEITARFLSGMEGVVPGYHEDYYHLGIDIMGRGYNGKYPGDFVYAIADGELYQNVSPNGWQYPDENHETKPEDINGKGNVGVWLKHKDYYGNTFYALYGHIRLLPEFLSTKKVKAGKAFARIGSWDYNKQDHLHLSISTDITKRPSKGWGKRPISDNGNTYGQVDPIEFLFTNLPEGASDENMNSLINCMEMNNLCGPPYSTSEQYYDVPGTDPDSPPPYCPACGTIGTGGMGGDDPGDTGTSDGPDVNVKRVEVSKAGKDDWRHKLIVGPGQKFDIETKITNKGDEKAKDFTINYHRSDDKNFTKKDKEVDDDKKVDLKPGKSIEKHARKIKAPSKVGDYFIFVRLSKNKGDNNPENDFSRNDDSEEYAIIFVRNPNLYVKALTIDGRDNLMYFDPGSAIDFRATIKNGGGSINKDVTAKYFFSTGFNNPQNMPELNSVGAVEIGSDKIGDGKLESGEETTRSMIYTLPTTPGQYTITAFINPSNAVKESTKDDNCRSIHFTVLDPNAPSDLDIISVKVGESINATVEQNEEFQLNVNLINHEEAGGKSGNSLVKLFSSTDQDFDTTLDTELTTIPIGYILPSQIYEGVISIQLSELGTHYIFAQVIDPKDNNSTDDISLVDPIEFLTLEVIRPNRLTMYDFYLKDRDTDQRFYENGAVFQISDRLKIETMSRDNRFYKEGRLNQDVSVIYFFFKQEELPEITPENLLTLQRIGIDRHEPGEWGDNGTDGEGNKDFNLNAPGNYTVAAFLNPFGEVPRDEVLSDNIRYLNFTVAEPNKLSLIEFSFTNLTTGEKFTTDGGIFSVGDKPKISLRSKINGSNSLDTDVFIYYYIFEQGAIPEINPENLLTLQRFAKDWHEPDEWNDDGTDGEGNEDLVLDTPGNYTIAAFLNPIGEITGDSLEDNIRYLNFQVK